MIHAMNDVVNSVNAILPKGLKYRQFQSFLLKMNTQYKDLVDHSQARWISPEKVLQRFLCLIEKN